MRRSLIVAVCVLTVGSTAWAQEHSEQPFNIAVPVSDLWTLFTDLYGPDGLVVDSQALLPDGTTHSGHFTSNFQTNFSQFSTALVRQLVTVPQSSPASGFTFEFDPALGVFRRSTTRSAGPILAERAETIGAGRIAIGSTFQRFAFDRMEGLDLRKVPAVFQHDDPVVGSGREDVVTTMNSIEAAVSQFTTFLNIGVSDRFDVSVAVPIIHTSLRVVSEATLQRIGTTNPATHFFLDQNGDFGTQRAYTAGGSATGLGDVSIRLKGNMGDWASGRTAVGLDMRVPTGNEKGLLGSGAAGVRPFAVWSTTVQKISPHVNLSYQWNGSSVLAGNPATGESASFPDEFGYVFGADMSVNPSLTLAFDLLGRYSIDAKRMVRQEFRALDNVSVFPGIAFEEDSFNTLRGSIGAKTALLGSLLLDVNLLFALDDHGLTDSVTALAGIEYGF